MAVIYRIKLSGEIIRMETPAEPIAAVIHIGYVPHVRGIRHAPITKEKKAVRHTRKILSLDEIMTQAFKARHSEMGTPNEPSNGWSRREKDRTFRNAGRKPLPKDRRYRAKHYVSMIMPANLTA